MEEAKQVLHLNMLLEQQAHEHDQVQGSLKAALKAADEDIEKLKGQCHKLQSALSTETALRERDQEDAQKELKELARLQLALKERDDLLESMRTEAIMLKAEVLTTASPQSHTPLKSNRKSVPFVSSHTLEQPSPINMSPENGFPASEQANKRLSMTAGTMAQSEWQSLMASSSKLSLDELLLLARQRKIHLQEHMSMHAKREIADMKASSSPPPAVCASWQALLMLLGILDSKSGDDGESRCMDWRALRKLININPGQFDKASVFHLMERLELGLQARPSEMAELRQRCKEAELLLEGITYDVCVGESVTIAALFEWITLVLDVQRLVDHNNKQ